MKKTADISVDAGTSHSGAKKTKAMQEHEKCTSNSEDSETTCETTNNEYTKYDT